MNTLAEIGSIASIISLAISIVLVIITKKAKLAAEEARNSILGKSLVYELREIREVVKHVDISIKTDTFDKIIYLLRETNEKLNYFKTKWVISIRNRENFLYIFKEIEDIIESIEALKELSFNEEQRSVNGAKIRIVLKYFAQELGYFDMRRQEEN